MTQEIKQVDITIEAGADFQMLFIVRDESGNLVNLTGSTVEAQLREYAEASDYLQFTATHNGSGGKVSISMPHEDTAVIPYTAGVYDVYITDTNNIREKYLTGDVTVIPSVTKPVAGEIIYLLSFSSEDDFPTAGIVRRIYFSHASNKMYRWNGTNYVSIVTDGEAATVEIGTVTTLDAGSDATVTNSGSEYNAVFNFGIPKGDAGTTSWEGITDKPETFTPSAHTHDDRYYTENEVDTALSGKSDTGHTHDDRYYTENEVDTLLSAKADTSTVNSALASKADASSVYTKGQVDTLVGGKVSTTSVGSLAYQNSVDYTTEVTNKPTLGDLASQNTISYESTYLTNKPTLGTMSAESASDYYTKTETDTLLSAKADSADLGTMSAEDASDYYDKTATDALLAEKADIIHTSASGSLVHITDGAPMPVTALSVSIDPVQDLHGYDSPWPAGGGVNLLPWFATEQTYTQNGVTVKCKTDGTVTITGTLDSGTTYFKGFDLPATVDVDTSTYIHFLNTSTQANVSIGFRNSSDVNLGSSIINDQNKITAFSSAGTVSKFIVFTNAQVQLNVTLRPMICKTDTATSWTPYSNICPISGHSTATVTRTGKNLVCKKIQSSNIGSNGEIVYEPSYSSIVGGIKKGQTYTVTTIEAGNGCVLGFYENNPDVGSVSYDGARHPLNTKTFTAPITGYVAFRSIQPDYTDAQLELGSPATAYEAPHVQTVTIDLGSTVYGGTLDAVAGTLTVTHKSIAMNSLNWVYSSGSNPPYFYSSTITDFNVVGDDVANYLCSIFKAIPTSQRYQNMTLFINSGKQAIIVDTNCSDLTSWNTEISGQTLVYELATPTVITGLTPAQIQALIGLNNVWADTGDVAVGYRASTKLYIDSKLASAVAELQALILENS